MARKRTINLVSKKTIIRIANAVELKPDAKYLIQVPDFTEDDVRILSEELAKMGVDNIMIANTASMNVVEVKK